MNSTEPESDTVVGERQARMVARASSITSRIGSFLALALMLALGLGMLAWYYAHSMVSSRSSHDARSRIRSDTQGDMPLPGLGHLEEPRPPPPSDLPPDIAPTALAASREIPLAASPETAASPVQANGGTEATPDRRFSGSVFSSQTALPPPQTGSSSPAASGAGGGELATLLRSGPNEQSRPVLLPTQRLLLPKGAFLDCTLETAIDSTLPGMTTCVMATDTFGADGEVVLLERGTKLVGETRGQVQQGSSRIFVIWNEARTPEGVIVPLASPGADELGRSGLPGTTNRHFLERFGAAILVSIIDGVAAGASQSRSGTVIVNPAGTEGVMTEVLRGTINIPPTVLKQQGDRIQVLVARDLDFRSVYDLAPQTRRR
ncbi:MAG TPA: type IV secretion system protein VirB10 [Steroidobacteraceae bacterium]|nr:type IV secretion system protein VirB10 [Steroidobacteraceae bacterium]